MLPVTLKCHFEDIQVTGEEHGGIEGLGDEGDALGTTVGVYRPYQNQLGSRV